MEEQEKKPVRVNRISLVAGLLQKQVFWLLAGLIFSGLVSLLDLFNPRLIAFAVDCVLGGKEPENSFWQRWLLALCGGKEALASHIGVIALFVIAVALLGAFFRFMTAVCTAKGTQSMLLRVRKLLFDKIMHLPLPWYQENKTGDLLQRCTSDVDTLVAFLSSQLMALLRILLLVIVASVFMWQTNPTLTLIALALLPVIVGYSLFFYTKIGSTFELADEEEGRVSSIVQENLTGVRVVRAFGKEAFERNRFVNKNRSYTGLWVRLMRLLAMFWTSSDLISGLQVMLVTIFGAVYCVKGDMTAGNFIAFVSYNAMLTWPVRQLGRVISEMSKAGVSMDRIAYILSATPEPEPGTDQGLLPEKWDITFSHVNFTYPGTKEEVLHDVSFVIPAGATVGLMGATGSGKTTIMDLLGGLYTLDPEKGGHILVGGRDLSEYPPDFMRIYTARVMQEPFLFSRTIKENIGITLPENAQEAGPKKIEKACDIAALTGTLAKFEKGIDTFVGERGVSLSGGQKQRCAIAQALVKDCPVLLLDDALSAVDAETDAKIREGLKSAFSGATVLLSAHRITSLRQCDTIIVMDRGRVVSQGTHEELIEKPGLYRRIYDIQTTGV